MASLDMQVGVELIETEEVSLEYCAGGCGKRPCRLYKGVWLCIPTEYRTKNCWRRRKTLAASRLAQRQREKADKLSLEKQP